jgi:O-antigen/teichoic acid export membrane protein
MIKFLQHLWEDSWRKVAQSFWLFFGFFLSQIAVQFMNMVTGFLIIRVLAKDEYADYTIINTLVPVMLMLSDNGIGTGISAIGRHIWQDNEKMGRLVNTGMMLRRKFALVTFVLIGPLLAWMLYRNHAPIFTIVILMLVTLTGITFQLTSAVMRMVLELRQHIKTLGKVSLTMAVFRLSLVALFSVVFHLNAFLATLASTCAIILEASYYIRSVRPQIFWEAPTEPEYQATIFSLVKQTMPLTIYFCIQGQISIWLISIFGSAHQVADIGAVSRLGIIFSTVSGSYSAIMVPRFARNNGRRRLFMQLTQIISSIVLMLVVFVVLVKLFPYPLLMLLGAKYANMSGLLWLVMLASGLNSLAGMIYSMNLSKGWIPPAIVTIPIEFFTQVALIVTLNLSKTVDVLIFQCLAAVPPMILATVLLLRRISREAE